jgi:hypothetical protein
MIFQGFLAIALIAAFMAGMVVIARGIVRDAFFQIKF